MAYIDDEIVITDRTQDDVIHWEQLRNKVIEQTATDAELTEWLTMELRGCLNYKDFNRWGRILNYLATQGIQVVYPTIPKTDWEVNDDISQDELDKLFANLQVVRNITGTPRQTPQVPTEIKDYNDANTIETILKVGNETIVNTQLGWKYCGDVYAGNTY